MVHQKEISLQTSGHGHMQDITEHVARIVAESGAQTGTAHVFNIGSTASIGTIEFELLNCSRCGNSTARAETPND
jgi:thiamine phosphate synthase YjbQ (UPF0047 family)